MKRIIAIVFLMLSALANFVASQTRQIAKAEKTTERKVIETTEKTENTELNLSRERAKIISQTVGEQPKPLSLREAVEMALQNNPDIQITQKNVKIAEFDLQSARGAFDTGVSAATDFERAGSPLTNSIFSTGNSTIKNRVLTNSVRVEKPLNRFGTIVSGEFSNSFQTTNDPFNSFRRSFQPAFGFSLVQPVLKGRNFDDARRQIEIAEKNLNLTDQQFRQRTIEIIAEVQRAYWDLAFALKDLQVQQDAVRDTKEPLETTRRKVEQGLTAPIEIVSIENQVAKFESAVYASFETVMRAQNALKNLITADENSNLWNEAILPIDDINLEVPEISLGEALTAAYENRLELKQNETSRVINEINRRFYKDRTKPQFDLKIGYTLNGFAGTPNDTSFNFGDPNLTARVNELSALAKLPPLPVAPPAGVPANLNGGFNKLLANLFRQNFNAFQFRITFNFPLENRTAKAELGKNLVEAEKLDVEKRRISQNTAAEVRNAVQRLHTLKMRLQSAQKSRETAETEYESERRKYNSGYAGSSLFLLLEKQKNLTSDKAAEIQIRLELNKAIAEYQRATGNLSKEISNLKNLSNFLCN
ncbi:MAG: TolC family protein [Pyrinomonadaceae bacterium]|nr:TolC family protein [Pyrinomonadaceae bacterium]